MSIVTKEGITVKVGQVWRDLDVRMVGRTCVVTAVHPEINGAKASVSMDRITPGKSRTRSQVRVSRMHKGATGWALVSEPAA
ncbi:hypothetical protein [Massilia pseudoviolaceinigra]|uniref:hypothetical protein n=1 Tax=Massilia pseudoviolaceinigra TaxID=3057165 RepID=UPI00279656F2|nr:hypothetical protein [Massilia sp. CCM 9206]MDQ1921671.1 hypothetical protein [Massilia sp. CCM 9206]